MTKFLSILGLILSFQPLLYAGENLTFGGDTRLRFQHQDTSMTEPASRFKLRFRLWGEAEITDRLGAGFRLASGGEDPASADQVLGASFESYDIRLDYGFLKYSNNAIDITAGKFPLSDLLWVPSDLIWGEDITPDGLSLKYTGRILDYGASAGLLILNDTGGTAGDPFMYALQLRGSACPAENIKITGAATYYGFENLRGRSLKHSAETNTMDGAGNLLYDYDSISAGVSAGFSVPILRSAALFGEYLHSLDSGDTGFLAGGALGKEIRQWPDWRLSHLYRRLGRDAWIDITIDRDTFGGRTASSGTVTVLSLGLSARASLDIAYFSMRAINGDDLQENLLQITCSVDF